MSNHTSDPERATAAKIKLLGMLMNKGYAYQVGTHKEDGEYYLVVNATEKVPPEVAEIVRLGVDGFRVEVKEVGKVVAGGPLPDKPDYKSKKDEDGSLRDELLEGLKKK